MQAFHRELKVLRDALQQVALVTGPLGAPEADVAMSTAMGSLSRIETAAGVVEVREPKYPMTYCSSCGEEQGPGDCGISHCKDHRPGWPGRKSA